jgi:PAS domain S-box-containing protein
MTLPWTHQRTVEWKMPGDSDPHYENHGASGPPVDELYRKVFEHSNDAVMVVDFDDERFVDVNPAACELLGYTREELLDLDPEDIHPEDFDDVRDEFLRDVLRDGSGWTDDLDCVTKGGETVPTEISGASLDVSSGDGGESTWMVAMLRDVSERVAYEHELEAEVERLDQFASVLSHDLRNPLNVVSGRVDLAEETGDPEHFEAIRNATERMNALVDDVLVVARQGETVGTIEAVDLASQSQEAWRLANAPTASLSVETGQAIAADPSRVKQLLANLFRNAVEHGGSGVTVTVGDLPDGFFVADDGTGLPSEGRDSLFDRGVTEDDTGTGLGLAIVASIADDHGWEVVATDSADGGARLEVTGVGGRANSE